MSNPFTFNSTREAYVLEGPNDDARFRIFVPRDFVDDELGGDATAEARESWLHANLPHILTAYTARVEGGWVKAPWNRVLVEEIT